MIRPHLEYASPVWNPHMHKDIKLLENVEKFAIQMITKRWISRTSRQGCSSIPRDKRVTVQFVYVVQDCSQPVLLSVSHHYT